MARLNDPRGNFVNLKYDELDGNNPFDLLCGTAMFGIGLISVAFAMRGSTLQRQDISTIEKLWKQNMTISRLKTQALAGKELPDLALIKGRLGARGPNVRATTT